MPLLKANFTFILLHSHCLITIMKSSKMKYYKGFEVKSISIVLCFFVFFSFFVSCKQNITKKSAEKPIDDESIKAISIPFNNFGIAPEKKWDPMWEFLSPNHGPIRTDENAIIESNDVIYLKNPSIDFNYQTTTSRRYAYYVSLLAYDLKTKKVIWNYKVTDSQIRSFTIQDQKVFLCTNNGSAKLDDIYFAIALDQSTGKEIWKCKLLGEVRTNILYQNNQIIFGVSGIEGDYIYCLEPKNGKAIFIQKFPSYINLEKIMNFVLIEDSVYFTDSKNSEGLKPFIIRFDFSPRKFWIVRKEKKQLHLNDTISPLTQIDNQLVYKLNRYLIKKQRTIVNLKALNSKTYKIEWQFEVKINRNIFPLANPMFDEKNIYFVSSGFIVCLDRKTKKIVWSFCLANYDIQKIFFHKGKFYLTIQPPFSWSQDRKEFFQRYLLSMDAKSGKILWKLQKGVYLFGVYKDSLLVGTGKNLYQLPIN